MPAPAINAGVPPGAGGRAGGRAGAGVGADAGGRAGSVTVTVTGAATDDGVTGVTDAGAGKELAPTLVDLGTVVG